jgi:hypothetical protein
MRAIFLVALLAVITPAVAQIGPPTVTITEANGPGKFIVDTNNITITTNASGSPVYLTSFKSRGWAEMNDYDSLLGVEGCAKGQGVVYTQDREPGAKVHEVRWFDDGVKVFSGVARAVCRAMMLRTYLNAPGGKV